MNKDTIEHTITPNTTPHPNTPPEGHTSYEEVSKGHGVIERGHEWYMGDTH